MERPFAQTRVAAADELREQRRLGSEVERCLAATSLDALDQSVPLPCELRGNFLHHRKQLRDPRGVALLHHASGQQRKHPAAMFIARSGPPGRSEQQAGEFEFAALQPGERGGAEKRMFILAEELHVKLQSVRVRERAEGESGLETHGLALVAGSPPDPCEQPGMM